MIFKKYLLPLFSVFFLYGCVFPSAVPEHKLPVYTLYDMTDLVVFKTDELRVIDVKTSRIAYEYNDTQVTLAQVGDHAKRYCQGKGRDTVLVDMVLTNRHNFRRAYFECKIHPVLVPYD